MFVYLDLEIKSKNKKYFLFIIINTEISSWHLIINYLIGLLEIIFKVSIDFTSKSTA